MLLAHIMGVPVEEVLTPLASGAGAGVTLWLSAVLMGFVTKRRRHSTHEPLE